MRNDPKTANSSSIDKHLISGPYGSSGCSLPLAARLWNSGMVVMSPSISLIATSTAWTVSTRWSFRRRSM